MERNYCRIIALGFLVILGACGSSQEEDAQASIISYENIPAPKRNLMTDERVALGKMLFHDKNLSGNGKVACVDCHEQKYAFGENMALSTNGITQEPLHRNTPPLINIAWAEGWFWEGGAKNIESLMFGPLTHPNEMGANLKEVVKDINDHPEYPVLFQKAYQIKTIKSAHIARALAAFCRSLISNQSKYDQYLNGEIDFSYDELQGMKIVETRCGSCHPAPFFTDFNYHNIGLDSVFSDTLENLFQGRARITLKEEDMGKYKTPTLRNIFASAPYTHDGRFKTIDEVFDHYESGILPHKSLAPQMRNGIDLNEEEREQVKIFLTTLMDSTYLGLKQ
ncbi:cytochrome-c peroxidase [Flammeovirga sp. MY04]|uniref:cytochrome-c peroxidase n=1 Tax=Flammeovirga sp. MY04 TaxID=1191459 RepID=UPI0008061001|nr:cytochrome c peroxidase [Flammeovirga sp. MY04]ANQ47845.1 cytochrome-c peroxidase [Flammeovirga sp. MY04]